MSMTIRYELQLLAASLTVGICLMMVRRPETVQNPDSPWQFLDRH